MWYIQCFPCQEFSQNKREEINNSSSCLPSVHSISWSLSVMYYAVGQRKKTKALIHLMVTLFSCQWASIMPNIPYVTRSHVYINFWNIFSKTPCLKTLVFQGLQDFQIAFNKRHLYKAVFWAWDGSHTPSGFL